MKTIPLILTASALLFTVALAAPQHQETPTVCAARKEKPAKEAFIGLSLEAAEKLADDHALRHRVIMIDGEAQAATRDYRPERLNFTVVKGKVTEVSKG